MQELLDYFAFQLEQFGGKPIEVTTLTLLQYNEDGVTNTGSHETFGGNDNFRADCVESYYNTMKHLLSLLAAL